MIFKDISPVSKIHYLCIPKKHLNSAKELKKADVEFGNKKFINSFIS